MPKAKDTVDLLITSAVMIGGKMVVPDKGKRSEIAVANTVATDLLRRGKAELLTEENAAKEKAKPAAKAKPADKSDEKPTGDSSKSDADKGDENSA